MQTITDAFISEHAVFRIVFNQIEQLLPRLGTLDEVKILGELVEGLLQEHADKEENLAYAALDHVLADKGVIGTLYQDHREIDARLARIKSATNFAEARRLLQALVTSSRDHFRYEERLLFPLVEKTLKTETLLELGRTYMSRETAGG